MKFEIDVTLDTSMLKALEKNCKILNKRHIRTGWIDGKSYPASHPNKGLPIATVANWQEFGRAGTEQTPPIPSRPYFRQALNIIRYSHKPNIKNIFITAITGGSTITPLESLADEFTKDYSQSVLRQNYKKLSGRTVLLKGHSYQMDDSGYMIMNYKSKVYRTSSDSIR